MESKLGLNFELVDQARASAAKVADDVQHFIDQHTTVTVERAVCRLLGIDGVNDMDVPLPNVVVDHLMANSLLPVGTAWAIGNAMVETGKDPQGVADAVSSGELDLSKVPAHSDEEIRAAITPVVNATVERINKNVGKRNAYLKEWGDKEGPYLYIIVATGNIYEDIIQAKAGAKQGADIIAVIRTTGQSLLDYVPYGATTEGFGGTYATQENFRLMRAALDEVGEEQHRYIRLCNYCSGLCMPEIAAMGALERLDVMLNDALYGILFRDINMQRTIVDQYFSRVINGYAGVIINTGEDNYLTTDDAITAAHTVLASQFLNEAFAKTAGMREEQMGLGHAFEMDPAVENTFLYELAQAQMAREIFPNAPLKYMPPTKFMTGNIFRGHIQDALFNMVTILTNQRLCLLGMMTEAIHTPFMSDRALSIENAQYIFRTMKDLGSELTYKENGIIRSRANEVLTKATDREAGPVHHHREGHLRRCQAS
jgi:beta-lysine 5,6-aminomutase alpha subunit